MLRYRTVIGGALALGLSACGGGALGTAADLGVTAAADLTDPAAWARGPQVEISGLLEDFQSSVPLVGYQVCLRTPAITPARCTSTDGQGRYRLMVPAAARIAITGGGPDTSYLPEIIRGTTSTVDRQDVNFELIRHGSAAALAVVVGQELDDTRATVSFAPFNDLYVRAATATGPDLAPADAGPIEQPFVDGVSIALDPATGQGPFYFDRGGLPSTRLSATRADTGLAAILNAAPGVAVLRLRVPAGLHCEPSFGWPSSDGSGLEVELLAGYLTNATVRCR